MIKPNTFVIGGCRSGTTSLCRYLSEHPDVLWADPSTTGYFALDYQNYRYIKSEEEYRACFPGSLEDHQIVGEGTTWYFYSREALSNILAFNPDAKFLLILRNPVEQIQSFHNVLVSQGNEDVADFATAWNLREKRKSGFDIPATCQEPSFLYYGDIARFGSQLQRLYEQVGRDRVMVMIYDDYIANTEKCYGQVLEFLDLSYDGRSGFPIINPNRNIHSQFLARLTHQPSNFRLSVANKVKKMLGIESLGVSQFLIDLNTEIKQRTNLPAKIIQDVNDHYREEVDLLSRLLGRDLSYWFAETDRQILESAR